MPRARFVAKNWMQSKRSFIIFSLALLSNAAVVVVVVAKFDSLLDWNGMESSVEPGREYGSLLVGNVWFIRRITQVIENPFSQCRRSSIDNGKSRD